MNSLNQSSSDRLVSLDAFRGAIMLLMASSGFGIPQVAKHFPDSAMWRVLGMQFEHTAWTGCTLWDLIQPSFMFMVGVALPWSVANRRAKGQGFFRMFVHALWRSLLLILLAVFLTSVKDKQTNWTFPSVLAQIGFGYPILFLLAFAKPWMQWLAAMAILVGYWAAFATYPLPPSTFDWAAVGVADNWQLLTGFARHWEKGVNFAANFDLWFLNLFPRKTPFKFNGGGYQTLNFVPSLATMIFGLIAGRLLRSELTTGKKVARLVIAGIIGIALGKAIEVAGICPIGKRIWTPSWAIFSAGIVAILLAGFVTIIDWGRLKGWAFPLVVAGLNPITLYVMWQLSVGFTRESLKIHLGQDIFSKYGDYAPVAQQASVLLVFWLVLFWMYRRKFFIRL